MNDSTLELIPPCYELGESAWDLHCELEAAVYRPQFNLREAADVAKGLEGTSAIERKGFRNAILELERVGCIAVQQGIGANGDCRFVDIVEHSLDPTSAFRPIFLQLSGEEFVPYIPSPRPMLVTEPSDIGVVYVLGSPTTRLVKIGHSATLPRRTREIQMMSPVPLSVLWTYPGGKALEGTLHESFKAFRQHGEWFDFGEVNPVTAVASDVAWTVTDTPDWNLLLAQQDREIREEIQNSPGATKPAVAG